MTRKGGIEEEELKGKVQQEKIAIAAKIKSEKAQVDTQQHRT